MNNLRKFNQNSDKSGVDFEQDGLLMILTNDRGQRTLTVLISNGTTAVPQRIANNVPDDADVVERFNEWVKANSVDGTINTIKGEVYASHNIQGLGRPIILDNGVQLQKDASGQPRVVSRFATWFPDGRRDGLTADFKKANQSIREEMLLIQQDMQAFRDDTAFYEELKTDYKKARANQALNLMKIAVLESPYIPGMSTAYLSKDESEVRQAFENSGYNFDEIFPDGFELGPDENAVPESDSTNTASAERTSKQRATNLQQEIAEEVAQEAPETK